MARYRKKPVVIDAMQIPSAGTIDGWDAFHDWMVQWSQNWQCVAADDGINIVTLEGTMHGAPGDWVICGVAGEIYPCRDDIFRATYEPVGRPLGADAGGQP